MSAKPKLKLEPSYSPENREPEKHEDLNRRSLPKLLIYPRFQLLLIGGNLTVLFLTFLGFWITSQKMVQNLAPAADFSGVEVEYFQRYLAYQETQFRTAFLIALALAALISGGVTLILSHRLAGPIVRLRSFLRAIVKGKTPSPLTFRDGDFLSDLPDLVNEAVDTLRRHRH